MDMQMVRSLVISGKEVVKLENNTEILWEKKEAAVNRWNLRERTEFIGDTSIALGDATYYFDPTGAYVSNKIMPLSEDLYYNCGRRINNGVYLSINSSANFKSTLKDVDDTVLTFTSGNSTELFIAIPFHLNAGETFHITYYSNASNRSGYQIFNIDGTYRSYALDNQSGAGNKEFTYTAEDECWIAWQIGKYNEKASVTLSDIMLTITS